MTTSVFVLTSEAATEQRKRNREAFDALPQFDLERALAGEPYTDYYGVTRDRSYCDIRPIAEPNAGWLVWVGEWTVYELCEEAELYNKLRMAVPK